MRSWRAISHRTSSHSTPRRGSSGRSHGRAGIPKFAGTPEARRGNTAPTARSTVSLNPSVDPIERRPAPGIVDLRPAVPADLAMLRQWDRDPDVRSSLIDGDCHWETELPRQLSWREWLIAEVDGTPIGFIQIIDPEHEETKYWGCMNAGHRAIDIWIGEP